MKSGPVGDGDGLWGQSLGPPVRLRLAEPLPSRHKVATSPFLTAHVIDTSPVWVLARLALKVARNRHFGPLCPRFSLQYCPRLGINDHILFRVTNREGSDHAQEQPQSPFLVLLGVYLFFFAIIGLAGEEVSAVR